LSVIFEAREDSALIVGDILSGSRKDIILIFSMSQKSQSRLTGRDASKRLRKSAKTERDPNV
jgi:hypothetical protein